MKQLCSAILSLAMILGMASTVMASEEIVGTVGEEATTGYIVDGPEQMITPRVFVGTNLFSITVSSLKHNAILTTINSTGKTILSSSGYKNIGIYPKFNATAKVGVTYVGSSGEWVSVGSVMAKTGSASFKISLKSGHTHYGYVKNTSSSASIAGSVSFVGMR